MEDFQEPSAETVLYCPSCAVTYDVCKRRTMHKPIVLRTYSRTAPSNFWKDLATNNDNNRTCDSCEDNFSSQVDLHACCAGCHDYNFCGDCLIKRKADFYGHDCESSLGQPGWDYFVFEGVNEAYYHQQMRLAEAEKLRMQREQKVVLLGNKNAEQVARRPGMVRRRTSSSDDADDVPRSQQARQVAAQSKVYPPCRATGESGGWFGRGTFDVPVSIVGDLRSRWGWG